MPKLWRISELEDTGFIRQGDRLIPNDDWTRRAGSQSESTGDPVLSLSSGTGWREPKIARGRPGSKFIYAEERLGYPSGYVDVTRPWWAGGKNLCDDPICDPGPCNPGPSCPPPRSSCCDPCACGDPCAASSAPLRDPVLYTPPTGQPDRHDYWPGVEHVPPPVNRSSKIVSQLDVATAIFGDKPQEVISRSFRGLPEGVQNVSQAGLVPSSGPQLISQVAPARSGGVDSSGSAVMSPGVMPGLVSSPAPSGGPQLLSQVAPAGSSRMAPSVTADQLSRYGGRVMAINESPYPSVSLGRPQRLVAIDSLPSISPGTAGLSGGPMTAGAPWQNDRESGRLAGGPLRAGSPWENDGGDRYPAGRLGGRGLGGPSYGAFLAATTADAASRLAAGTHLQARSDASLPAGCANNACGFDPAHPEVLYLNATCTDCSGKNGWNPNGTGYTYQGPAPTPWPGTGADPRVSPAYGSPAVVGPAGSPAAAPVYAAPPVSSYAPPYAPAPPTYVATPPAPAAYYPQPAPSPDASGAAPAAGITIFGVTVPSWTPLAVLGTLGAIVVIKVLKKR